MPTLTTTYTDLNTIRKVLPSLLDNDNLTPEMLLHAAAEAEAEINGHVALRYALPFTTTIPLLTTLATNLAIFKLLTNRPFQPAERSVDSGWPDRYREAIAILLRIAEGDMVLVDATGAIVPMLSAVGGAWSRTMQYTPTFGEGADQGFTVDRNKVEDEAARRP